MWQNSCPAAAAVQPASPVLPAGLRITDPAGPSRFGSAPGAGVSTRPGREHRTSRSRGRTLVLVSPCARQDSHCIAKRSIWTKSGGFRCRKAKLLMAQVLLQISHVTPPAEPSLLQTRPAGTAPSVPHNSVTSSSGCSSRADGTCVIAGDALQDILHFKQPATLCTCPFSHRGNMKQGKADETSGAGTRDAAGGQGRAGPAQIRVPQTALGSGLNRSSE